MVYRPITFLLLLLIASVATARDYTATERAEKIKKILSVARPSQEERTFYRWQSVTSGDNLVRSGQLTPSLFDYFMKMEIDDAHFAMGRGVYVAEDMTSSAQFLRDLRDGTLIESRLAKGSPILDLLNPEVLRDLSALGISREDVRSLDPPVHVRYENTWWVLKSQQGVTFQPLESSAERLAMIQAAMSELKGHYPLAHEILQRNQLRIASPELIQKLFAEAPEKAVIALGEKGLAAAIQADPSLSGTLVKASPSFSNVNARTYLFRVLLGRGEPIERLLTLIRPSGPEFIADAIPAVESAIESGRLKPASLLPWFLDFPRPRGSEKLCKLLAPEILKQWYQLSEAQQLNALRALEATPKPTRARKALELLRRSPLTDPVRSEAMRLAFANQAPAVEILKTSVTLEQLKEGLSLFSIRLPNNAQARGAGLAELIPLINHFQNPTLSARVAEMILTEPSLRLAVLKHSGHLPGVVSQAISRLDGAQVRRPGVEALLMEIAKSDSNSTERARKLLFEHGSKPSEVLKLDPNVLAKYRYDEVPIQAVLRAIDLDPDFVPLFLQNTRRLDKHEPTVAKALLERGVAPKTILQSFFWVGEEVQSRILSGFLEDIRANRMSVADLLPWIFDQRVPKALVSQYRELLDPHIPAVIGDPNSNWPRVRNALALLDKHPKREWALDWTLKAYQRKDWNGADGYVRRQMTEIALGNGAKSLDLLPIARTNEEVDLILEAFQKGVAQAPEGRVERLRKLVPFLEAEALAVQKRVAHVLAQEPELAHHVVLAKYPDIGDLSLAMKNMTPANASSFFVRRKLIGFMNQGPEITDISRFAGLAYLRSGSDPQQIPGVLVRRLMPYAGENMPQEQIDILKELNRKQFIQRMNFIAASKDARSAEVNTIMQALGGWNGTDYGDDWRAIRETARRLAIGEIDFMYLDVNYPTSKARVLAERWVDHYTELLPRNERDELLARMKAIADNPPSRTDRARRCASRWAGLARFLGRGSSP